MITPKKRAARAADSEPNDTVDILTPNPNTRTTKRVFEDIGIAALVPTDEDAAATATATTPAMPPAPPNTTIATSNIITTSILKVACDHLATVDPLLAPLINEHGPPDRLIAKGGCAFATLSKTIVFQQLATKAATVIFGRVLETCGCTAAEQLNCKAVREVPLESLQQAGLSQRKASYLHDLARHFDEGLLSDELIEHMDMETLHTALTAVKGLGPWSVDMFAMFHMGRPDCLPTGDLGVRRGMQMLYGLKDLPSPKEMEKIAEAWSPYRSVGSYFMWRVDTSAGKQKAGTAKKKKKIETAK